MAASRRLPYSYIIDGVPRCPFTTPGTLRQALEFVPRKGDLLQSSFPRSGTHWVQYITQMILAEGKPIDSYEEFSQRAHFIEYRSGVDAYEASAPVRSFCTHLPLRKEKLNKEAKYIYVARNPWDVCVSLYHHMCDMSMYRFEDGTFDDFVEAFLTGSHGYGCYFEHVMQGYSLKDEPNVLFLTYEELKKDPRSTVLRLAGFINERYGKMLRQDKAEGIDHLDVILARSSAENMRRVMVFDLSKHPVPEVDKQLKMLDISSRAAYEGDPKRHSFIRKGAVGNWKQHFTREQLSLMEATIAKKTRGSDVMKLWNDIRREALGVCSLLE
ncbi:sulfotransferase 1A1-like [Dermacentor albipictus]|uniref:sulfotransferase 1A1-like n=1 Tax=Dermacentor albipictus TaxID=60249 RepID=UPI0031FD6618